MYTYKYEMRLFMSIAHSKIKNKKLLQIYIEPNLHKALGQYCLDKDTKNAPVVRKILARFLESEGYYKRGDK